ncbi:MAG: DUF2807 domain-containing protein [Spirochaetaceae bacterium]|nr:DUF2807 domain-containing protein [Spirochaetaceae bacterium]
MKKSQIAMLAAAGLTIIMMLIVMGIGRIALSRALDSEPGIQAEDWTPSGEEVSETLNLNGFDTLVVESVWTVQVKQSDEFSIKVFYPSNIEDEVHIRVRGKELVLGLRDEHRYSGANMSAEITMPSLSEIQIDGSAYIEFGNFNEDEISIVIDGAADVNGYNSSAERLSVNLDGMGKVDLSGVAAVDARVELNGAGDIRINMNGGVLDGVLDGMGNIVYSGTVSEEKIRIEGLGKVRSE